MKCNLFYSNSEWIIIDQISRQRGFSDPLRFLHHTLLKNAKNIRVDEATRPAKKSRRMLRINNPEIEKSLKAYARQNGISVTVLIRRLTADPLVLLSLMASETPQPPAPVSPLTCSDL